MSVSKFSFLFLLFTLALLVPKIAKADPVSFQNVVALHGASRVDLESNPNTSLIGPEINFLVDITGASPANGINTLKLTFRESGQPDVTGSFRVPLFDGLPADYSQLFSFRAMNPTVQGVPVVLSVQLVDGLSGDILQSGQYEFRVTQPVPEPAALSLMTLGLLSLYGLRKRKEP